MRKNIHWDKIVENRFNHLLVIFILLFIVSPFFQADGEISYRPILSFIWLIAVIGILRSIVEDTKEFIFLTSVKVFSFILDILAFFHLVGAFEHPFHIFARLVQIVVVIWVVVHLTNWLFSIKKVDADAIKGGICIYFLLGLTWMAFYRFLYEIDPGSFSTQAGRVWEFMYLSFSTLTTTGHGGMIPVSSFAMMLTSLEAVAGQLFLVIFITQLVILRIMHSQSAD